MAFQFHEGKYIFILVFHGIANYNLSRESNFFFSRYRIYQVWNKKAIMFNEYYQRMSVSELTFIICLFSIQILFVQVLWLFLLSPKSSNIMERISSCLESLFVRRTTILCLIFYTNTLDNILLTSVGKSSAIISFLNIYNLPYVFLVVVFFYCLTVMK